jgi:transcriptional regulator GlxA family with amidase domain
MTDFTILLLPGSYASSVAATLDILQAASTLAPRLRLPSPGWRVISPGGGNIALGAGMHIATQALAKRYRRDASCWIIPGLGVTDAGQLQQVMQSDAAQELLIALRAHHQAGGRLAASCSAVFLLQAAGILSGRRVTTSWWMAAQLRQLEASCSVDADCMVCSDGNLITAGAAFAQIDLMLHLLRVQFGTPLADALSRSLLIDGRQAQAPYIVPAMLANGNAFISRLLKRIETALPHPPSVEQLAAEAAMSSRTLSRRVQQATGKTTMALIQSVRVNRARMLLETSKMSVESIAAEVGYEDATALRRLMRSLAGGNPGQYRGR